MQLLLAEIVGSVDVSFSSLLSWAPFLAQGRCHFAYVAQLHDTHDALLGKKWGTSIGENETSTDPRNQAKVDAYKSVAGPIMQKYGATMPPHAYSVSKVMAGQSSPSFMLKIEFSDKEKAIAAFADPEYINIINVRDEGFGDLSIYMVE